MNTSIVNLYTKAKPLASSLNTKIEFDPPRWSRMEVILKVTERCNIDCTYCYFFNSTNQDFKDHPAYIKAETVEACAVFLANAVKESGVQSLQIDFHGGEPLMMKKHRFDEMCTEFRTRLKDIVKVTFVMQTNAMLIDQEWLEIFAKHEISVGISLDGPKVYHDVNRLDHQGKGTYDQTIRGLRLVQESNLPGLHNKVGVICVIDPSTDARTTFNHFVDDLQLTALHYLLPMEDHDTYDKDKTSQITKYLRDLFDAWVERENPEIHIRYFGRLLAQLIGGKRTADVASSALSSNIAFTIASNGDIGPADDIRNTFPQLFWTHANVSNTSLKEFIKLPAISNHFTALRERHDDCGSCCWGRICDGGDLVGTEAFRYSNKNSFRNKSIYCESIQDLLTHMTKFSLKRGVSFDRISEVLIID